MMQEASMDYPRARYYGALTFTFGTVVSPAAASARVYPSLFCRVYAAPMTLGPVGALARQVTDPPVLDGGI